MNEPVIEEHGVVQFLLGEAAGKVEALGGVDLDLPCFPASCPTVLSPAMFAMTAKAKSVTGVHSGFI